MHQHYLNRMAITQHFRKINIFLTMTTDPNWPETKHELLPGQTVTDQPDLVACMFQLKKKGADECNSQT